MRQIRFFFIWLRIGGPNETLTLLIFRDISNHIDRTSSPLSWDAHTEFILCQSLLCRLPTIMGYDFSKCLLTKFRSFFKGIVGMKARQSLQRLSPPNELILITIIFHLIAVNHNGHGKPILNLTLVTREIASHYALCARTGSQAPL